MRRHFVVEIPQNDGSVGTYPMKGWLRQHPEHIPVGLDPNSGTSWELRNGLKKGGWFVTKTPVEVRLTMPGAGVPGSPANRIPGEGSERRLKMSEDTFAELLVSAVTPFVQPHRIERKRSLLYDLSFNHRGIVTMGVDPDSGEPIRGGGRGFEQDILGF
ncbi:MAG: hypothetical protein AAB225_20660 [Acidobacteriota bacterium]